MLTAAPQHTAYPDLGPLTLRLRPDCAYVLALDHARALDRKLSPMNQKMAASKLSLAVSYTGVADEIVIHVAPSDDGARIDVHSHSRIGRIDRSFNTKRILAFLGGSERESGYGQPMIQPE